MRALIFDLDGTLLDTLADIANACNAILGAYGYPQHPVEAYAKMVGNGFDMLARRCLPRDRMPDARELEILTGKMREYYAQHFMEHTHAYPGMEKALTELAKKDMALGVLSNKPDPLTKALIAYYFPTIPFFAVQGAVPEEPLKPNPAALLKILAASNLSRHGSAYAGDSDVDMLTAANAGMTAIGVAWGFRGAAELEQAGAAIIINEPLELITL